MITKAEIIELKGNKAVLRIPLFETAGSSIPYTMTSTICSDPGCYNGYKIGDKVYIGFENKNLGRPIVLGKLNIGVPDEPSNFSCNASLEVTDNAKLPENTIIGDINFNKVSNCINDVAVLNNRVTQLESKLPTIAVVGQCGDYVSRTGSEKSAISVRVVNGEVNVGDELVLSALVNWKDVSENPHHSYTKKKHRTIYKKVITEDDLNDIRYTRDKVLLFKLEGKSFTNSYVGYTFSKDNRYCNIKYIRIRRKINDKIGYICSNHVPIRLYIETDDDRGVYVKLGSF